VSAPRLATNPVEDALRARRSAVVGFDFPIGVPSPYAAKCGIASFLELLPQLGWKEWRDFFTPADAPDEITLHRPFYPRTAKKGSAHQHLVDGLGVASMNELRRLCELGRHGRGPAEVLFWTLGPKQVGKAAIAGWREILIPARREIRLWPFEGSLEELVTGRGVVVCETYPAEFYGHFGIGAAKAAADARVVAAPSVTAACADLGIEVDQRLAVEIGRGFASEDAYDAFVGLIGMINVILGNRPAAPGLDPGLLQVEGWILGQE